MEIFIIFINSEISNLGRVYRVVIAQSRQIISQ